MALPAQRGSVTDSGRRLARAGLAGARERVDGAVRDALLQLHCTVESGRGVGDAHLVVAELRPMREHPRRARSRGGRREALVDVARAVFGFPL